MHWVWVWDQSVSKHKPLNLREPVHSTSDLKSCESLRHIFVCKSILGCNFLFTPKAAWIWEELKNLSHCMSGCIYMCKMSVRAVHSLCSRVTISYQERFKSAAMCLHHPCECTVVWSLYKEYGHILQSLCLKGRRESMAAFKTLHSHQNNWNILLSVYLWSHFYPVKGFLLYISNWFRYKKH